MTDIDLLKFVDISTLILDCMCLIKMFWEGIIKHIYREGNHCVDFLANQGTDLNISAASSFVKYSNIDSVPPKLVNLFEDDVKGLTFPRFVSNCNFKP
ncbi:hypothetical protein ACH5RR_025520 [Cinchona calisaya]|uniref:RNase H type-1 domain-containing protein n=1 Tax=Cinchona calisaya TaxID=153742 RepID=A0ABD2YZV7_9GENT